MAMALLALAILMSCAERKEAPAQPASPARALAETPSTQPATSPSAATQSFQSAVGHFEIAYSSDWKVKGGTSSSSGDYQGKKVNDTTVLTLLPADAKNGERNIAVDLPELPVHIPGLIPLGLVVRGYTNDLRKQHPDLKIEESAPATVPARRAHRVRLTWKQNDRGFFDMAVLVVHGNRILIFSADGDADGYDEIRKVFDSIITSIKWLK